MIRRPPSSTLFPSPPLSRSLGALIGERTADLIIGKIKRVLADGGSGRVSLRNYRRCDGREGVDVPPVQRQLVGFTLLDHRSEEHTSELQSRLHLVCRLLLEK